MGLEEKEERKVRCADAESHVNVHFQWGTSPWFTVEPSNGGSNWPFWMRLEWQLADLCLGQQPLFLLEQLLLDSQLTSDKGVSWKLSRQHSRPLAQQYFNWLLACTSQMPGHFELSQEWARVLRTQVSGPHSQVLSESVCPDWLGRWEKTDSWFPHLLTGETDFTFRVLQGLNEVFFFLLSVRCSISAFIISIWSRSPINVCQVDDNCKSQVDDWRQGRFYFCLTSFKSQAYSSSGLNQPSPKHASSFLLYHLLQLLTAVIPSSGMFSSPVFWCNSTFYPS